MTDDTSASVPTFDATSWLAREQESRSSANPSAPEQGGPVRRARPGRHHVRRSHVRRLWRQRSDRGHNRQGGRQRRRSACGQPGDRACRVGQSGHCLGNPLPEGRHRATRLRLPSRNSCRMGEQRGRLRRFPLRRHRPHDHARLQRADRNLRIHPACVLRRRRWRIPITIRCRRCESGAGRSRTIW